MTTYLEHSVAVEAGEVVELFELRGPSTVSRWASGRSTVEHGGQTYLPAPIKRGTLATDTDSGGPTSVTVSAPPTDELKRYLSAYPAEPSTVRIWRRFVDGGDWRLLFSGRVLRVTLSDNVATARCESGAGLLENKIPSCVYSAYCQHRLFDDGCGLESANYVTRTAVTLGDEGQLIAPAFATQADGWFTGGHVQMDSDFRMVTRHEGNTLYLHVPFDGRVRTGSVVSAWPGCDGSPETCTAKFNNVARYLGMPYIPASNPVLWGFK